MNWFRNIFFQVINRMLLSVEFHNHAKVLKSLGSIGAGAYVEPRVRFNGSVQNIYIGDNVRISGDVIFQCDENSKIVIGDNCNISGPSQILTYGGSIFFGHSCSVNPFCIVYGHGGLTIGNFVRIAAHSIIIPANHIYTDPDRPIAHQGLTKKGIRIEDDVWVGSGVRILDGSDIGYGSVLGCSTVINNKIEPYSIVVGIPGKKVKTRKT